MNLLTDVSSATSDPTWGILVQALGVPAFALFLVGFLRGWLVSGNEYKRIVEERNQERDERIKAQEALTDKTLPIVLETQEVLKRATRIIDSLRYEGRGRG